MKLHIGDKISHYRQKKVSCIFRKHFALPDNVPLSLGAPAFFGDMAENAGRINVFCRRD